MLGRWLKGLRTIVNVYTLFSLSILSVSAYAETADYSSETYEVYFGDFNGDGLAGDVYYHRKDTFVLIHSDIAIPLQIANDGSYVVYEGTETPVSLTLAKSALGGYTKGVLNADYYFTDADSDGDVDIVALNNSGANKTTTLVSGASGPSVTVYEQAPENIEAPALPVVAVPGLDYEQEKIAIDKLQSLGGSFRVDESGSATYSIPITVPAGTAGVAPEISLNYSSSGGNGIAGLGWSLSGVGSISRCQGTKAQDGHNSALSLTSSYLCLNGQRLIQIKKETGNVPHAWGGSYYRTEIDSGVEVYIPEGRYGVPDYFEVRSKDGSIATYGAEGNDGSEQIGYIDGIATTFEVTGEDFYPILQWKLKEFKDSVGNKITYHYNKSPSWHVIERIDYAYGNSSTPNAQIKFEYEDRQDPTYSYIRGYKFGATKRLRTISTYSRESGSLSEVYRYKIVYHDLGDFENDSLSRVKSIQLCASGQCYDEVATHFTWGSDQINFDSRQSIPLSNYQDEAIIDVKTPDIDGDGRLDLVWLSVRPSGDRYAYYIYYKTVDGSARSFYSERDWTQTLEGKPLRILDYNADGRSDIAFNGAIYIAEPVQSGGWGYSSSVAATYTESDKTLMLDINGDGLIDLVEFNKEKVKTSLLVKDYTQDSSSKTFYKFGASKSSSVISGSSVLTEEAVSGWTFRDDNLSFGDFNGDGRMDVVALVIHMERMGDERIPIPAGQYGSNWGYKYHYKEYAGIFYGNSTQGFHFGHTLLLREGTDLLKPTGAMAFSGGFKIRAAADVNSDGIADLVFSGKSDTSEWKYAIFNGKEFLEPVSLDLDVDSKAIGFSPMWLDYNYDGFNDIAWHSHTENTSSTIRYKTWNPKTQSFSATQYNGEVLTKNAVNLFDFNGDGRLDIVELDPKNAQAFVRFGRSDNRATHATRIYKIKDGLKNETDIRYAPLNFNNDIANTYEINESHYRSIDVQADAPVGKVCEQRRAPTLEEEYYEYCYEEFVGGAFDAFYRAINEPFDSYPISFKPERSAPILEMAGALHVVTSVSSSSPYEGNANNKASVSYYYERLRMQAAGRGSLGFRRLTSVDNQSGVSTVTTYRQDWPFIGMPESTITYANGDTSDSGIKLKESHNSYTVSTPYVLPIKNTSTTCLPGKCLESKDYGPINLWVDKSIETTYALKDNGRSKGEAVSTLVTTIDKDDYGNVTTMTVSTHEGDENGALAQQVVTQNSYLEDGNDEGLFLGRLTQASVTTYRPGSEVPRVTRSSTFTYNGMNGSCYGGQALKGLLCTESIVGGATTQHFYDSFGNKTFTYTTGDGLGRHSAYTQYDSIGRYPVANYGIFNHADDIDLPPTIYKQGGEGYVKKTMRIEQRNRFGGIEQSSLHTGDDNWLTTYHHYTDYGVRFMTAKQDGSYEITTASTDTSLCPSVAKYSSTSSVAGGGESKVCYDSLGREVRTAKKGFDGIWIFNDFIYDGLGRLVKTSEPYFKGSSESGKYWTEVTEFDLLGRALSKKLPFNVTDKNGQDKGTPATSMIEYDDEARTSRYTGPAVIGVHNGLVKTEIRNVLGEIIEVIEVDDGRNVNALYEYDVFGKLTKMTDSAGNTTKIKYNALGQKRALEDPDKGNWSYSYNKLGELLTQTDAKNQVTLNCYDFAGRLITRYDYAAGKSGTCSSPGQYRGVSAWFYDTSEDGGLGQLASERSETTSASGVVMVTSKTYSYDSYGRLIGTTTTIPADTLQPGGEHYTKVTYDEFGRVAQNFDAARSGKEFNHTATENEYNDHGYLCLVKNADQNSIGEPDHYYYEINNMNARGQVTKSTAGGVAVTETRHYSDTGRVKDIVTTQGYLTVQSLSMKWDTLGNLASRSDMGAELNGSQRNLMETFEYDARNRLHSYRVGDSESKTVTVDYNAIGNITTKSDVGSYSYVNAGPHAVTKAGSSTYIYDRNGNVESDSTGRSFIYTTFDKLEKVAKGSKSTEFYYDANRNRYKRIDVDNDLVRSKQTVTLYVGGVEKVYQKDGTQQWKRTIAGSVQVTHRFANNAFQGKEIYYMHRDHLGSITAITSADGGLVQTMAFDPWGQRRNTVDWAKAAAAQIANFFPSNNPITTRGFTGHEMVDALEIIHMNGRIYDARLGRFLQADSVVDGGSYNIQGYNRYSYGQNNPLNGVDPSGHNFFRKAVGVLSNGFFGEALARINPKFRILFQIGACISGNMLSCAGSAFGNTYAAGGSFKDSLKAGAFAGVSYYAFTKIGTTFDGTGSAWNATGGPLHILAHATTGGAMAELQGGEFRHGFISAGLTKGLTPAFSDVKYLKVGDNISIAQAAIAAVVGGTISEVTGGKFANGAVTAAFANVCNQQKSAAVRAAQKGQVTSEDITGTKTTVRIRRFAETDEGTIGELTVDGTDFKAYTLEPAGASSVVEGSDKRILAGTYEVERYNSAKYKSVYEVQNVPGRTKILFHVGNFPEDTLGCFLVGQTHGTNAVYSSAKAFSQFRDTLSSYHHLNVTITNDF